MDIAAGKPVEPPSSSRAREVVGNLKQLLGLIRALDLTKNVPSFERAAEVLSSATDVIAHGSGLDLNALSKRELLQLLQKLDQYHRKLHILSAEVSEGLLLLVSAGGMDEKLVGRVVPLLANILRLSVAETGVLNKLARPDVPRLSSQAPSPSSQKDATHGNNQQRLLGGLTHKRQHIAVGH